MHYNKKRGLTAWSTIIFFMIFMQGTEGSPDDNATNATTILRNSGPILLSSLYYSNLTMDISPLTHELSKFRDYIQRADKNLLMLFSPKSNSKRTKVKRAINFRKQKSNFNRNTVKKRDIFRKFNHISNREKIEHNFKSFSKHKFVDKRLAKAKSTAKLDATYDEYTTTECYYPDETTLEENIVTSGKFTPFTKSTTRSTMTFPTLPSTVVTVEETICDDEVTNDDGTIISTESMPFPTIFTVIQETTTKFSTTSSSLPPSSTTDVSSTTCKDDDYMNTESLEFEESVEEPIIKNIDEDDDVDQFSTSDFSGSLDWPKKKRISHIELMKNLENRRMEKSPSLPLDEEDADQFEESLRRSVRRARFGRTLKSIKNDEYTDDLYEEKVTAIEKHYQLQNQKSQSFEHVDNENSIGNENSLSWDSTEALRKRKENHSRNQKYSKEMNNKCTDCVCDMENAIASLKSLLTNRGNLIDRISEYSCDKFIEIGKYLELIPSTHGLSDEDSSSGSSQTITELDTKSLKYFEFNDAKNILRVHQINLNEHELLYISGTSYLLDIPCHHDVAIINWLRMSSSPPNYTWVRHDGASIPGIIKSNGDLILHEIDMADVGNYSCIVTYINPDNGKLIRTIHEHMIKLVTLPHYTIRGDNRYRLDICDEHKLNILATCLPIKLNEILCKSKFCDAFIFAPQCHNHEVIMRTLIIPSSIMKIIPPILTSQCGLKCHKAIYDKVVWLLLYNLRIILRKPIIFRFSNHRHEKLAPISKKGRVQAMLKKKQERKIDAHYGNTEEHVGLLVGCPAGYSLESNFCEPCPSNFHSLDLSWRCQQCPLGTYQPNMGAKTCDICTNPFIKGCSIMLWSLLSIVLVVVVTLAMFLIIIIILWTICFGKTKKRCSICEESNVGDEKLEKVPLIDTNETHNESHNHHSISVYSQMGNDTKRETTFCRTDEKPLLIYGVNLLPLRHTNQRSHEEICRYCGRLCYPISCRRNTNKR